MANICCNEIKVWGSQNALDKLSEAIDAVTNEKNTSLFHLAEKMGVEIPEFVHMRGCLDGSDFSDDMLTVYTETAWEPTDEYWDIITQALNLNYASSGEECGEDVYIIHNDPEGKLFPQNFLLDLYEADDDLNADEDCYYFESKDEAIKWFNAKSKINLSLDDWISRLDDDCKASWHEFARE